MWRSHGARFIGVAAALVIASLSPIAGAQGIPSGSLDTDGQRSAVGSPEAGSSAGGSSAAGSSSASAEALDAPVIPERLAAQKPRWSSANCSDEVAGYAGQMVVVRVECATVTAPLDWRAPGGPTIDLRMTRTSAAPGDEAPILFTNPGGPGGVGDMLPLGLPATFPELWEKYQVIAVDVRGVGGSTTLDCPAFSDGVADYRDRSATTVEAMRAAARDFATECARRSPLLPFVSTYDTAADHELVRRVLGGRPADWFGYSAASRLIATHDVLFPGAVGRAVVDSGSGITGSWNDTLLDQPRTFQRRYREQFLPWAARHSAEFGLGGSADAVAATVERLRARVGQGLVQGVTPNDLDRFLVRSMPGDETFLEAAQVLQALDAVAASPAGGADPAVVTTLRDVLGSGPATPNPTDAVNTAIRCNDSVHRVPDALALADGRARGERYPLMGFRTVVDPCAHWVPAPRTIGVPLTALRAQTTFVHTELDPSASYEGAEANARAVPGARMLSVDDAGHHGVVLGNSMCANRAGLEGLLGDVPAGARRVCGANPLVGDDAVHPVGHVVPGERLSDMAPASDRGFRSRSSIEDARLAAASQVRRAAAAG